MVVLLAGLMTVGLAACGGSKGDDGDSAGGSAETYTISYNLNNGNTTDMPDYQFMGGDLTGILNYESRFYVDITLALNDDETYDLKSDVYTMSNGERIEVGASDGIGMVCILNAEGTYTDNGDGTVTTSAASHASFELEGDTYSAETIEMFNLSPVAGEDSGEFDSDDTPALLDWVPETVFTLGDDGDIVTYARADGASSGTDAAESTDAAAADGADATADASDATASTAAELITMTSDDGATTMTLYDDGSYKFAFDAYQVEDAGTYTYDAASNTLTLTDANGTQTTTTADGDNVVLHYTFSQNDQLTGDFTVAAADLTAALA